MTKCRGFFDWRIGESVMKNEKKKKETEQAMRLTAHLYCVNLLSMLLEISVITEEEFVRIKAANAVFYKASDENCIKI